MQIVKQVKAFNSWVKQYTHDSIETQSPMKFSIYLPPNANESNKVPFLIYLAGLTCNDELLFIKAPVAIKIAAERGIAIVTTDTSPRGLNIEGEDAMWDFGTGAGFYVDATESKWKEHYRMFSYVSKELPALLTSNFPLLEDRMSIMGHSMGGHGALTLGIRHPEKFRSISAFAPISHPCQCPWGIKAFTGYLGTDQETWKEYDATTLMLKYGPVPFEILIDQGTEDTFYHEKQLLPAAFETACGKMNQKLTLRYQEGYDHSYYFISTFIEEHITFHANALFKSPEMKEM